MRGKLRNSTKYDGKNRGPLSVHTYFRTYCGVFLGIILGLGGLVSCTLPAYHDGGSTNLTSYEQLNVAPLSVSIPADFIRGVDVSMVQEIEELGGAYYDGNNQRRDPLAILKDAGVNWVRLRLWNNPRNSTYTGSNYGHNDIGRTVAIARRAKALGLKVLLDFHYSDTWADPAQQVVPASWAPYTDIQDLADALYDFTYTTIQSLATANAVPDMVQIGNEIDSGMLFNWGKLSESTGPANLGVLLDAASDAVRAAAPQAKIMIHLSRGGRALSGLTSFFDRYATHGGTAATVQEIDFDIIGLSYYPYYASHGTVTQLKSNIEALKNRYEKEVLIAETSYGWTTGYGDSTTNVFWEDDEEVAATNLEGQGLTFATRSNGTTLYFPATIENQAVFIRLMIGVSAEKGALGIFYWGGDWIPALGVGSTWENQALFDFNGKALPSLTALGVRGNN